MNLNTRLTADTGVYTDRMQIRADMVNGDRPACPRGCSGRVHCHGRYARFSAPTGMARFSVARFRCYQCGLTISVLPADRLPYRSLAGSRLQRYFTKPDACGNDLNPAPTETEAGCLRRAWRRFQERAAALEHLLGLSADRSVNLAAEFWIQMCASYGDLSGILRFLNQSHQRSLLGDYHCLRIANGTHFPHNCFVLTDKKAAEARGDEPKDINAAKPACNTPEGRVPQIPPSPTLVPEQLRPHVSHFRSRD